MAAAGSASMMLVMFAAPASAATVRPAGPSWAQQQIAAQLKREPGGVVTGNMISYDKGKVTIRFVPRGTVSPAIVYHGCNGGQVCFYSDPNQAAGTIILT